MCWARAHESCHIFRLSGRGSVAIWGKVKQTRFVPITKSASAQSPALLMVIAPNIGWKGWTPPKTKTGLIFLKLGVYDLGRGGDRDQSGEVPWEGSVEAQVGRKGGWTWESRSPQRSQFAPELLLPALIDGKVANTCSGSTLRTAHRGV